MAVHYIVPGKYLPKSNARLNLDLVTVCETCHGYLEDFMLDTSWLRSAVEFDATGVANGMTVRQSKPQ